MEWIQSLTLIKLCLTCIFSIPLQILLKDIMGVLELHSSRIYSLLLGHLCNVLGLILMFAQISPYIRKNYGYLHKITGRIAVGLALYGTYTGILLSKLDMYAESHYLHQIFTFLGVVVYLCIAMGVYHAINRRFDKHELWMSRFFGVYFVSSLGFRFVALLTIWIAPNVWWFGTIYACQALFFIIAGFLFGDWFASKSGESSKTE